MADPQTTTDASALALALVGIGGALAGIAMQALTGWFSEKRLERRDDRAWRRQRRNESYSELIRRLDRLFHVHARPELGGERKAALGEFESAHYDSMFVSPQRSTELNAIHSALLEVCAAEPFNAEYFGELQGRLARVLQEVLGFDRSD